MPMLLHPPLPSATDSPWRWSGLHGSARALALAEAVSSDSRPWVFVAADTRELERLAEELRFFGGAALEILTLPDWEVLPYDIFSPHPDIVSQRLRTLSRLPRRRSLVCLISSPSRYASILDRVSRSITPSPFSPRRSAAMSPPIPDTKPACIVPMPSARR